MLMPSGMSNFMATSINNSGIVVGNGSNYYEGTERSFTYFDGNYTELPGTVVAFGINDIGVVTGYMPAYKGFFFKDGSYVYLLPRAGKRHMPNSVLIITGMW